MQSDPEHDPSASASTGARLDRWLGVAAMVATALVLGARLFLPNFTWDLWSDRDLTRALDVGWPLPTEGAELSHGSGARIPGGLHLMLLAPLMALRPDPAVAFGLATWLDAAGAMAIGLALHRRLGPLAAGFGALGWVCSGISDDTVTRLWNPAFVSVFAAIAMVAALRVVMDRDARALPWLALGVAGGAQMHLSMGLLGLGLVLCVGAARPQGLLRAAPGAAAVLVTLYLPWLLDQLDNGFAALHALRAQDELRHDVAAASAIHPEALWIGLRALAPGPRHVMPTDLAAALRFGLGALPVAVGLVALLVGAVRAPRPLARGAQATLATLAVVLVYYVWDRAIHLEDFGNGRYLAPLLPVAAVMAGAGAVTVLRLARRGGRVGQAIGVVVLVSSATVQTGGTVAAWRDRAGSMLAVRPQEQVLAAAQAATGGSLTDLAGRTVLMHFGGGEQPTWSGRDAISFALRRQGATFPGSLAPPCAAVLLQPGKSPTRTPVDVATLDRWLGVGVEVVSIVDESPLGRFGRVVRYVPNGPHCPTSLVQPYVFNDVEAALEPLAASLASDGPRLLAGPPHTTRVAFVVPGLARAAERKAVDVVAALDLTTVDGGVVVTLHAAQLRGHSYNEGYLGDATLRAPTLVLGLGADAVRVVVDPGIVGFEGVSTPIATLPSDLACGARPATFVADLVPRVTADGPILPDQAEPRIVELGPLDPCAP